MNNVIYRGIVVPACEATDGETPTSVFVTEEVNLFVVWFESFESGTKVLKWFYNNNNRNMAIEHAVKSANSFREEHSNVGNS